MYSLLRETDTSFITASQMWSGCPRPFRSTISSSCSDTGVCLSSLTTRPIFSNSRVERVRGEVLLLTFLSSFSKEYFMRKLLLASGCNDRDHVPIPQKIVVGQSQTVACVNRVKHF